MPETREKQWTVLVYMVADDPDTKQLLDQVANQELDQIIFGGIATNHKERHVAIQVDFRSNPGVMRRVVGRGTWTLPESSATSWKTLHGFVRWAMESCPARHYILIFWGHSSGPFGMFRDGPAKTFVAQTLTLPELTTVLSRTRRMLKRPIDIVLFKDCFMGTLETAYELRKLAHFLITSQSLVPVLGWPYEDILGHVGSDPDVESTAMGIVADLGRYYSVRDNRGTNRDVPFSLIDLSKVSMVVPPLQKLVTGMTAALNGNGSRSDVRRAITGASPADPALLDVVALSRRLQQIGDDEFRSAARDLESAVARNVVADHTSRRTPQGNRRFGGLSLFHFPTQLAEAEASHLTRPGFFGRHVYNRLALCVDTGWSDIALRALRPPPPVQTARGELSSIALNASNVEVTMADAPDKTGNFVVNINLDLGDILKAVKKGGRGKPTRKAKKKSAKRAKR